jgi:predicted metal-dependent HD superfamily phosphohydrolase
VNGLDLERWKNLWRAAGAQTETASHFDQLVQLYNEPHRHYHNSRHIVDCLNEFDLTRHLAKEPLAVELAIWFHDAIYDPRAADNEERSADLAKQCITEAGLEETLARSVNALVLATKQHDNSLHPDAPLLVDIDLSILGQPANRFWEYENQICKEYAWVPEEIFRTKRAEILERFLARKQIYNTDHYFSQLETQARANLDQSIRKLRSS